MKKSFAIIMALFFISTINLSAKEVPEDIQKAYKELLAVKGHLVKEEYENLVLFVDEKYPPLLKTLKKYENLEKSVKYLQMFKKYLAHKQGKALRYLNLLIFNLKKEYPGLKK